MIHILFTILYKFRDERIFKNLRILGGYRGLVIRKSITQKYCLVSFQCFDGRDLRPKAETSIRSNSGGRPAVVWRVLRKILGGFVLVCDSVDGSFGCWTSLRGEVQSNSAEPAEAITVPFKTVKTHRLEANQYGISR